MPIQKTISKGKVPVKIYTDDIDHSAMQQLYNMSQLPIIHSHLAAMPDVHMGKGATVGSVIPTKGAIIPAAVGVDIGCGMNAVRLSIKASDLPDNLRSIRLAIEKAVPVGFNMHTYDRARNSTIRSLSGGLDRIITKHKKIHSLQKRPYKTWIRQIGTLGGGNHFIELCVDENQDIWIMLHSGSRGIGNAIGQYFIELAKKDMGQHLVNLPDKDLAYFSEGARYFDDYIEAVEWAQDYALSNRREMMYLIIEVLRKNYENLVSQRRPLTVIIIMYQGSFTLVKMCTLHVKVQLVPLKTNWELYREVWGQSLLLLRARETLSRSAHVPMEQAER